MDPINLDEAITDIKSKGREKWLLEQLNKAFCVARRGKTKTHDEHDFEINRFENMIRLRDSIMDGNYEPSPSVAFVIFDPMVREIFAAPFRDRLVHHFLYNVQAGWWDRRFIYDSYSCRVGKGTLFGVKRVQKMMRQVSQNGQREAYIIKMDISGYFMSLSRKKIYERVLWGLDQQFAEYKSDPDGYFLYKICAFLWKKVLFDDPVEKARKRGNLKYWNENILPARKSLFKQPPGAGIVIGNLTSQLVSNIFLDQLDRFVKFELGYKYYGRYVDDFIIIVEDEKYEMAKREIALIQQFLRDELGLKLHDKKRYIQPVRHGVEFLGVRIYLRCLYPSDRLQAKFWRAMEEVCMGKRDVCSIVSYLGLMKHLDANKFVEEIFDAHGGIYRRFGVGDGKGRNKERITT